MLWLCITLPQLPLEALQCEQSESPTVVTVLTGSVRCVVCCNPAAERVGLKSEMNFTTVLAILPEVIALERRLSAEQAALERLTAWAYQFSGTVIIGEVFADLQRAHSTALWLEIGASLRLFGGFRKLIEQLEIELRKLSYSYQLGISPTLEGSALLARTGVRVAITTTTALRARIEAVSVNWLNLDPWIPQQLQTVGVRTVGLLVALPRDGVAKRFGPEVCDYLDRLVGAAPDPRPTYRLPPKYHARFEFEAEVRSTEALLFPLRRMLREFVGFLRARDTGTQKFTLRFVHRDAVATIISIGLSMPDRNSERFLALTRERLEHTVLPSASVALELSADEFATPTGLHIDMLSGATEQSEELGHTLDRIVARLGEAQVHGVKAVADHRPEHGWATASAQETRQHLDSPDRPLWLLSEPKPLQLSGMPALTGAERIESGWWDSGDVRRDYFIARTQQGAALWIFKDLHDGSWHLHGFWS
ncbi:Y-family DNA polymerase [Steroidobacter sp.]|uniref:Y-family DNA polymerase n=1 Tax=Steroidobacter sp. TaxID=1978227 RepID=UPI001A3DDE26|nr:DNA polymerase Y family protein [Steroidobacter sp.]MBL8267702.1 DNA polymerase Y family protein [Steroidobacter sp.]